MNVTSGSAPLPHKASPLILIAIGAVGGFLSGLFGIGGGVVVVPALVLLARVPHRLAAGTSVAAILPAAIVGGATYGIQGHVDWITALLLAVGIVVGAQVGSRLLAKANVGFLQWLFLGFVLVVIASLWFVVPARDQSISLTLLPGLALLLTGFVTGILSGLLGVGGGIIVVPVLMFFFGASDLIAKGTSLVMMIPGSLSGTLANAKRRNVDLRVAAFVGLTACLASPLGALLSGALEPRVGNILFSLFLVFIFTQMLLKLIKSRRREA